MTPGNLKSVHVALLSFLFAAVVHITIRNLGSPLVLPAAYFVWITVAAVVLLSSLHVFQQWRLRLPYASKYILFFICLLFLSAFFNPVINSHAFIFETAGLIGGFIFFVTLHQYELTDEQKERIIYFILLSGLIEALIGLFQYFNPDTYIFLLAAPAPDKVFGNFQHQNLLASYLATSLVISLYLLSGSKFRGFSSRAKGFFYLAVLIICFVIFLTGSRAVLIEAGIGALILLAARFGSYREKAFYPLLWLIVVSVAATGSVATDRYYHEKTASLEFVGQKFEKTVESITGEEIKDARLPLYLATIEMIKERPVFGHGTGNFSSRFAHYRGRLAKERPEYPYEAGFTTHPHNEFLYRTAESGLLGGAGLATVFIVFIYYMYRLGRQRGGAYGAILFPIAFHTQVGLPLYQSMPHWVLFIFLLYLPSSHFVREFKIRPKNLLKTGTLTVVAAMSVFVIYSSITTLIKQTNILRYQELLFKGVIRPDLVEPTLNNTYLKQLGKRLYLDANYRKGLSTNNKELVENFADFMLTEKEVFPHPDVFGRGAIALHRSNRKDEAYELLDEGIYLYPNKPIFKSIKQALMSSDMKERRED
jgi:O-antigen polymerase